MVDKKERIRGEGSEEKKRRRENVENTRTREKKGGGWRATKMEPTTKKQADCSMAIPLDLNSPAARHVLLLSSPS